MDINANKYAPHKKSGYQLIYWSKAAICLRNAVKNITLYLPKSKIKINKGFSQGEVIISAPDWLLKDKEV